MKLEGKAGEAFELLDCGALRFDGPCLGVLETWDCKGRKVFWFWSRFVVLECPGLRWEMLLHGMSGVGKIVSDIVLEFWLECAYTQTVRGKTCVDLSSHGTEEKVGIHALSSFSLQFEYQCIDPNNYMFRSPSIGLAVPINNTFNCKPWMVRKLV